MEYLSTKDTAKKWNCSVREVQRLLEENRIMGAKRYGRVWMIPYNALKPIDPRKEKVKPKYYSSPYLTCGLLSSIIPMPDNNPKEVLKLLKNNEQIAQYEAEISYIKGNFYSVKEYYNSIDNTNETFLCAANVAIVAAISLGDSELYSKINNDVKIASSISFSTEAKKAAEVLPVFSEMSMLEPKIAPNWLINGEFSSFTEDMLPFLCYIRVKYFQSIGNYEAMLASAQTAIALIHKKGYFTSLEVYLEILCVSASYSLNKKTQVVSLLEDAARRFLVHDIITPFSENLITMGEMMKDVIEPIAPDKYTLICEKINQTKNNWIAFK